MAHFFVDMRLTGSGGEDRRPRDIPDQDGRLIMDVVGPPNVRRPPAAAAPVSLTAQPCENIESV